jgi:hypothetical protein
MLFITECKGTTTVYGLSRNSEAKMFYQLARTFEKLKKTLPGESSVRLGGIFSGIVNHYSRVITMNVNDRRSSFTGGLPDSWMYPDKDSESL